MLTGTLLSYRLSRWKLILLYLAVIPLVGFVLFELSLHLGGKHDWFFGIIAVSIVIGGVKTCQSWSRFVTEMHCTEVGIHVTTLIGGNRDVTWSRAWKLRRLRDIGAEFAALEITYEPPLYLYLGEETRKELVSLLKNRSGAEVIGFTDQ